MLKKYDISDAPEPLSIEVSSEHIIFWFDDPVRVKMLVKKLNSVGVSHSVVWEDGMVGLSFNKNMENGNKYT